MHTVSDGSDSTQIGVSRFLGLGPRMHIAQLKRIANKADIWQARPDVRDTLQFPPDARSSRPTQFRVAEDGQ
jgi:hypothetical protein